MAQESPISPRNNTPGTPRNNKHSVEVASFVQDMLDEMVRVKCKSVPARVFICPYLTVISSTCLDAKENEFTEAENSMLGKMDAMGKRMDDLERSTCC